MNNIEPYFENKGIVPYEEANNMLKINKEYLKMPADITNLTPYDLGEHLNAFTQQKIYLRRIQSQIEIQEELAKRRYAESFDVVYGKLTNSTKKHSEKVKEKLANMDEEVRPLYYEYCDWKKKLSFIEIYIKILEDGIFLFSREISRRQMDYNSEKRIY